MYRNLTCLDQLFSEMYYELEKSGITRQLNHIGMQVGLREILERKHLVEFASRCRIIEIYVNPLG